MYDAMLLVASTWTSKHNSPGWLPSSRTTGSLDLLAGSREDSEAQLEYIQKHNWSIAHQKKKQAKSIYDLLVPKTLLVKIGAISSHQHKHL
jgi:hypothetical protein